MKTHYLVTLCTALVVGAALIAVPATAVDVSKEKALVNDSWLTAKTKIALAADGRVKGRQIDVETTEGRVMLRGKVDSDAAKQAAEEITKMLDGVKTVKNDLEVVAPSTRDAVEDKDEAITTRVKEHIAKDAHLKQADIAVQTNAGVVSLTGEVRDIMASANASWTTRQIPRCEVCEARSHGEGEGLRRPWEAHRSCRFETTESTQLHATQSFTRRFRHEEAHRSVHVRNDPRCRDGIPFIRGW